jgi:hypothetical protein
VQCFADGGSNIRGNSQSAGVVGRQNTVGKSVRAPHGAKVIDFGAVPKMVTKMVKTSLIVLAVGPLAVMVAVTCVDESV